MSINAPLPTPQNESETSDYVERIDSTERARLVSQGVLHYSGQIAGVLSSLVLVPLMLTRLGAEAYGFWIVALAAPGFITGLDSALYLSISREAASHRTGNRIVDEATTRYLSACCGAYVMVGLVGAAFVVFSGALITRPLHLSASVQANAATVFVAVAIAFGAGRAVVFGNAVLLGFQRFGTMNAISVGVLVLRLFTFVVLLTLNYSIGAIAVCHAVLGLLECFLTLGLTYRLGALRLNQWLVQWGQLRRVGEFGVSSFLTTILQNLCWFSPPVLLGIMTGGTVSTTSLYAGQRPCFIVSELNWRGAEVLFSASASRDEQQGDKAYAELMVFGTKCVLAVAMPLCIGLFLLAPELVQAWLRIARPETATVMRLTALGVIADAVWVGPLHVLWGRGRARRVLLLTAALTASVLILNLVLIPRLGVAGVGVAFAVSAWVAAIATTIDAARETKSSWMRLLVSSFSDVALPSLGLAIFVLSTVALLRESPRVLLLIAVIGGGLVYAMLYWLQGRFRKDGSRYSQPWFVRKTKRL